MNEMLYTSPSDDVPSTDEQSSQTLLSHLFQTDGIWAWVDNNFSSNLNVSFTTGDGTHAPTLIPIPPIYSELPPTPPELLPPIPESEHIELCEMVRKFRALLLCSQMRLCINATNLGGYIASSEDIQAINECPVHLASILSYPSDVTTIGRRSCYPPPEHGTAAIVYAAPEKQIYRIADLPEQAQQLQRKISAMLEALPIPDIQERIIYSEGRPEKLESTFHYNRIPKKLEHMIQQLANAYLEHHRLTFPSETLYPSNALPPSAQPRLPLTPLAAIMSSHQTILPSIEHMRGLAQSFGPRVARSLWNTPANAEQLLDAPNGARLAVRGENEHERVALHQFIDGGMGVEGIKYMVTLMGAYFEQTGAADRKIDARVTLRQLLQFMGRGDHADDLDEQRKLMHYILYLSRTWVTALDKEQTVKKRGRPPSTYREYTPLIVLEALGSDVRGGIRIPDVAEFHLGKEYWDQMFGLHKHFFTIPTALIGVSISNPALCTLSKLGGLTDLLMWLHKRV